MPPAERVPGTAILALLELLQSGREYTGPELAARLDVDERTVRRYAARLAELGLPVTARRGRYGGYRLGPGYKLPPLMLTDGEAVAVTLGLVAATRTGMSTLDGETALAKLRRVLPERLRERTALLESGLVFTAPAVAGDGPRATILLTLGEAVACRHRVRLAYRSWKGEDSERDLDPYGIVLHSGRWYVSGHDHRSGQLRTFRLDRISAATAVAGDFTVPGDYDAVEHLMRSLNAVAYRWPCEILLHTTIEDARNRIPRSVGELSVTGHGVLYRTRAENLPGLAGMLATLGCDFTVREPEELRVALGELAERLKRGAAKD
ncbi:transcriptional regulator [Actinorhabdospora filicis]|uniref:Transcriptional regulator n=1 Tax=Actinorhabdospora filicis TaxID=1785913 RepID=A0A9W6SLZ9_9ACTN|nr:YafY family protein [Actinorhabdospora filicis]GLZ78693.1 transcriptional regulator [Actinorhabdospora filicis]